MFGEQFDDQFAPLGEVGVLMPAINGFPALQFTQYIEALLELGCIFQKVVVIAEQEVNASVEGGFDVDAFGAANGQQ